MTIEDLQTYCLIDSNNDLLDLNKQPETTMTCNNWGPTASINWPRQS